jgi:hypothetical protein
MREKPARLNAERNLRQAIMYSKTRIQFQTHKQQGEQLTRILASAHDVEAAWRKEDGR